MFDQFPVNFPFVGHPALNGLLHGMVPLVVLPVLIALVTK